MSIMYLLSAFSPYTSFLHPTGGYRAVISEGLITNPVTKQFNEDLSICQLILQRSLLVSPPH